MKIDNIVLWMIGALFLITMTLFGILYNTIDGRLNKIESSIDSINVQYSQISEIKVSIIYIQRDVAIIQESLQNLLKR